MEDIIDQFVAKWSIDKTHRELEFSIQNVDPTLFYAFRYEKCSEAEGLYTYRNYKVTYIKSRDSNYEDTRKIEENGNIKWEKKSTIVNPHLEEKYGIKINLKRELPLPGPPEEYTTSTIRKISRISIQYEHYRLDMSVINDSKYEIEMEITKEITGNELWQSILQEYRDYQSYSYETPSREEITRVGNFIDNNLKAGGKEFDIKLRDIDSNDLQGGRLVGGDITYRVTVKADGESRHLIIYNRSLWLCHGSFKQLLSRDNKYKHNIMLNGEFISSGSLYVIDDLIFFDELIVTLYDHSRRIQILGENFLYFRSVVMEDLKLTIKNFYTLSSIQILEGHTDYFTALSKVFEDYDRRPQSLKVLGKDNQTIPMEGFDYPVDGLVFIPDTKYNNIRRHSLEGIGKIPAMLKWKPRDKLTIDLRARIADDNITLYTGKDGKEIRYDDMKLIMNDPLGWVYDGMVIEFNIDDNVLKFNRARMDKTYPNEYKVIKKVTQLYNRGISREDLEGKTMFYSRIDLNRIKRRLFEQHKGNIILDIGSGRLGDISKYPASTKMIIAVEPNYKNRKAGFDRLIEYNNDNNPKSIVVLPISATKSEVIQQAIHYFTGEYDVDLISMMLSMTFFWDNSNFDSLISTVKRCLKRHGKVIYLTIDGDNIKQQFIINGLGKKTESGITIEVPNLYTLTLNEEELYIYLPDDTSILGKEGQHEWLVYPDQLARKLSAKLKLVREVRTDYFMTEEQQWYNNLFSSGYMIYDRRKTNQEYILLASKIGKYILNKTECKLIKKDYMQDIIDTYISGFSSNYRDNLEMRKEFKQYLIDNNVTKDYNKLTLWIGVGMILVFANSDKTLEVFYTTKLYETNVIIAVMEDYEHCIVQINEHSYHSKNKIKEVMLW